MIIKQTVKYNMRVLKSMHVCLTGKGLTPSDASLMCAIIGNGMSVTDDPTVRNEINVIVDRVVTTVNIESVSTVLADDID